MKTPRVHDFDPTAQVPELGSPLDKMPVITRPQLPQGKPVFEQGGAFVSKEPVPLVRPVLPVPPMKRMMKQRHPFDIYRDQYEALQQLALEERKQGGIGSMSAMVRQALDTFIAVKRQQKKGKLD